MTVRPRIVLAWLLAQSLGCATAHARPCAPIAFGTPQPSLEHAGTAALRPLLVAHAAYESGGFIIEQRGAFRASKPVTQRSRSAVNYCIAVPRGATLAGLYHTHVWRPEFSARDLHNSQRTGVPSFVGTIRDGALYVYDPRLERVSALGASGIAPVAAPPANAPPAAEWWARLDAAVQKIASLVKRAWSALG